MKALKLMMFFLLVNVSFWGLSQMGVWPVAGPSGIDPGNLSEVVSSAVVAKQTNIPQTALDVLGGVFTIEGFLLMIGTAVGASVFTEANIVKSAAIVGFMIIFLFFYFNTIHILTIIRLPSWLVTFFTGFHFIILMLGVYQLATGVSFRNLW